MGATGRTMQSFQDGRFSAPSPHPAQPRRRDPLPAAPARSAVLRPRRPAGGTAHDDDTCPWRRPGRCALQDSGAEKHAARLARDDYLPGSGGEDDAAPTPAARRQRARCEQGRFVAPVEVTGEMITALVEQGGMDEANSSDLDYVGKAITAAARRSLDLT